MAIATSEYVITSITDWFYYSFTRKTVWQPMCTSLNSEYNTGLNRTSEQTVSKEAITR